MARTQREQERVLWGFLLRVGGSSRTWGVGGVGGEGGRVHSGKVRAEGFFWGGGSDTYFSLPLCNFSQSATEGFSLLSFFLFFSVVVVVGAQAAAEHPAGASPSPPLRSSTSVAGPCGLAAATQPGPHVSPPTQLPTPESKPSGAEVRRRHTLERVTARGEGNTWPGANLLCTLSLSLSCPGSLALLFSQSLSHYFARPSPHPPHLFVSLRLSGPDLHTSFFFPYLCHTSDCFLRHLLKRLANRFLPSSVQAGQRYINFALNSGDCLEAGRPIAFLLKVILALLLPATGDEFHLGEPSAAGPQHSARPRT